ncbi:MAG: lytic transglycosylase domain-containing protein [Clostridia bacterium]|nr:lytic transglycosylase domain-containing protein [Clostridia bacterium]
MKILKKTVAMLLLVAVLFTAIGVIYYLYPLKYTSDIRDCSEEMGVDPHLVAALVKAESNFDRDAQSGAGAKGVMQLTDETAKFCADKLGIELKDGDIYNPDINIRLGVYYLKRTLELFDGDVTLAVAAYNAGEGRVREWLNDKRYSSDGKTLHTIPYEETKNHIEKIQTYQKVYKILYPNL